ncbi:MAG: DNA repair protein RadC [Muribaculaceae bacterium]|nr:DNA repair protein RadC [Muribaculaceae bacterium]
MKKNDNLPREKALSKGFKALSDAELMAILFGTGIKGKGVLALCEEILEEYGGHLSKIARTEAHEFIKQHKGIGPAKALTLLAGIELGVRAASDAVSIDEPSITSSNTAFEYMHKHLYNLDHEEFWVLLLRNNLKPLREFKVGQGSLTATAVDVKMVLREAVINNAAAMMIFHNHPSGSLTPSPQDVSLTRKISEGAKLFDIKMLDHIIVGHNAFYSFNDEGKI